MSYDVCMRMDTGCGAYMYGEERNYTYNCGPMLFDAMGEGLYSLTGKTGEVAAEWLERGIKILREDPEKYTKRNPANGWGSYEGFLEFLEWILQECRVHPKAQVLVT